MACREDKSAKSLVFADHVRGGGRRQDAALTDEDAAKAIGSCHGDRCLDDIAIVETAVAADDKRLPLKAIEAVENRLDKGFGIARRLENRDFLAKPGGAGFLVLEGGDGYSPDHGFSLFEARSSA